MLKVTDDGCSIRESVEKYRCDKMTVKTFFDKCATNAQVNFKYKEVSNCHAAFDTK